MKNYVITIARGFGTGGKEIALNLSKQLEIPCYESEILTMASEYSGLNEKLFHEIDEKIRGSYWIKRMHGILDYTNIPSPSSKDFTSDDSLYQIQAKIIRDLANTQSCIIVGKCANKILELWKNTLSVYIEAPQSSCVESIKNKLQVSDDEALKMIMKTDQYRSQYYKYYSGGGEWKNPINYDMMLNSARLGRETCADIIIQSLKKKFDVIK